MTVGPTPGGGYVPDVVASLAAPRTEPISWPTWGSWVEGLLKPQPRANRFDPLTTGFIPLAAVGAVAYSAKVVPIWEGIRLSSGDTS